MLVEYVCLLVFFFLSVLYSGGLVIGLVIQLVSSMRQKALAKTILEESSLDDDEFLNLKSPLLESPVKRAH